MGWGGRGARGFEGLEVSSGLWGGPGGAEAGVLGRREAIGGDLWSGGSWDVCGGLWRHRGLVVGSGPRCVGQRRGWG